MHGTWLILRWAWSAVVIVYCILAIIGDLRLSGSAKKRSRNVLTVMVVLVVMRFVVRQLFGGLAYRLAVLVVGIAAGIAALIVAQMLITQKPSDQANSVDAEKDRFQSLKLS